MAEGDLEKPLPKYEVGELITVDVGNGQLENIYVLEVNGTEVTGLLDRNLGSTVAWISEEDYNAAGGDYANDSEEVFLQNMKNFGPITANNALTERTSTWNNVKEKHLPSLEDMLKLTQWYQNLSDKSNFETKYIEELTAFVEANGAFTNCYSFSECKKMITEAGGGQYLLPDWAVVDVDVNEQIVGYWLSTVSYVSSPYASSSIHGLISPGIDSTNDNTLGILPIITVDMSNIITLAFAEDSWETIVNEVRNGNASKYHVGETKEVTLTGEYAGTYTVRIANNSTPAECNNEGFSQTACGFVVEFEDIITIDTMDLDSDYSGGNTSKNYPTSEMHSLVNDTIYNSLPSDLKEAIIDTYTVSGRNDEFNSMDKLYLLSTIEVWGSHPIYSSTSDNYRQLDYYKNNNVTTSSYSKAIKTYQGSEYSWWLREWIWYSCSHGTSYVDVDGDWNYTSYSPSRVYGVAPAFRIG